MLPLDSFYKRYDMDNGCDEKSLQVDKESNRLSYPKILQYCLLPAIITEVTKLILILAVEVFGKLISYQSNKLIRHFN
jgi:hypothetical protein